MFLCLDCFTVCFCVFCASVLILCTDSPSSCLIFVSSVWASLPEIKRWNGTELYIFVYSWQGNTIAGIRQSVSILSLESNDLQPLTLDSCAQLPGD